MKNKLYLSKKLTPNGLIINKIKCEYHIVASKTFKVVLNLTTKYEIIDQTKTQENNQ